MVLAKNASYRTAFRTNASILRQFKISSRLSSECLYRILNYFGHIARKDDGNLEKLIVTGKVEGKKPRGCSPIRWTNQIRTAFDSTVHKGLHTAKEKTKWKKAILEKVIQKGGHDPQHWGILCKEEDTLVYSYILANLLSTAFHFELAFWFNLSLPSQKITIILTFMPVPSFDCRHSDVSFAFICILILLSERILLESE